MAKNDTTGISAQLLDQLLAGRDPQTVLDSGGLLGDLKKALAAYPPKSDRLVIVDIARSGR